MANEVAQLQAVLTEAVKDMVDAARPSAPGGGRDGAGRFGSQHAGPHWLRLSAYIDLGGLINAEVQQSRLAPTIATRVGDGECRQWGLTGKCRLGDSCVFTHVGPVARRAMATSASRRPVVDRLTAASPPAALRPRELRLRRAGARARRGQGVAMAAGEAVAAAAAAAAAVAPAAAAAAAVAAGRRVGGPPLARQRPKLTNRGTGLAPQWGRGRSQGVRKRQHKMHSLYVRGRRPLGAQV